MFDHIYHIRNIVSSANDFAMLPKAVGGSSRAQGAPPQGTLLMTVSLRLRPIARTVMLTIPLILAHAQPGKDKKKFSQLNSKKNVSFREARQRASHTFLLKSFAEVVQGGSSPLRFSAKPRTAPGVPRTPRANPTGEAALAAPPSLNTALPKAYVNPGSIQPNTQNKEVS